MAFEGSCHCGNVRFTVEAELPEAAVSCNCSHCRRKGFLLAFFPVELFTLTSGEDELRSYFFNKHRIEHKFCTTCGTEPFAHGANADGSPMRAVNLRCVPALDLDKLQVQPFNGAEL